MNEKILTVRIVGDNDCVKNIYESLISIFILCNIILA